MARRSSPALLSRRRLLQGLGAGAGLVSAGGLSLRFRASAAEDGPRYLIVLGCFGGAGMLDCFLPVDTSQARTDPSRGTVISYDTVQPAGAIRCVNRDTPVSFLTAYHQQMVVMGTQSSSVNHFTAQQRSVNGRGAWRGRTLAEAVASVHGASLPLPNVNMGRGGYSEPGTDNNLDSRYRAEVVTNPVTFPLSTSGWQGVLELGDQAAQDPEHLATMIGQARAVRDGTLEQVSPFGQTFGSSRLRQELLYARGTNGGALEVQDLIQRLLFIPDLGEAFPLNQYGLSPSEEADRILSYLPDAFPQDTSGTPKDRLQAQAALAYLLLRTGSSAAVTLTDPGTDGFLAFDQSHQGHKSAQATHWDRALSVADKLIQLLSTAEYSDDSGPTGTSLWDRSMIVFATEFGRDKWDTGGSFGTGHHLNNGLLMVSPLIHGDQSLGQADPNNGFICGFDPDSGAATPFDELTPGEDPLFTDERLPPGEEPVFGTILAALGIGYDDQETLPVVLDGPV